MKKIIGVAVFLTASLAVKAQSINNPTFDKEIFNVGATIFTVALFMFFIITVLKHVLEYRIKNKIAEKGISENMASSILQKSPKEDRNSNIKWFSMLTGIGLGLTIINYTLPLGIHSLAIMSFSIAAGFLGYFFFRKYSEK